MIAANEGRKGVRMKFGKRLQELRLAAELSQSQLAASSGLSVSVIRNYEHGLRLPGWPAIVHIAKALGVPVDTFNDCDEAKPKKK